MNAENIILAYSLENSQFADEFESQLASAPIKFNHVTGNNDIEKDTLSEKLASANDPIILIISDNFLKSIQCMGLGIELLQKKSNLILPLVIDGVEYDAQTGKHKAVVTNFDRVSDIIKYINYWQDQYLDLRRKKRTVNDEEERLYNEKLKRLRDISSEVGEFLRLLRSMNHLPWDVFSANDFERFFRFIGNINAWHTFKANLSATPSIPEKEPVVESIESSPEVQVPESSIVVENSIPPVFSDPGQDEEEPEVVLENEKEEDPESATIELVKQGIAHFEAGEIELALEVMGKAVDQKPEDTELRYHYALMLIKDNKDIPNAIVQLKEIIRIQPHNLEAFLMLGKIAEQQKDFSNAKLYYEKVLELDSNHPGIHSKIGSMLLNMFDHHKDAAANYFERAIQINPNNVYATYRYAQMVWEHYGDKEKALDLFNKVLELQPDHQTVYFDLANLYQQIGNRELAHEFYVKSTLNNPSFKSEVNDAIFRYDAPQIETPAPEPIEKPIMETFSPSEENTIELIKQNLLRLEELLRAKKTAEEEPIVPEVVVEEETEEAQQIIQDKIVFVSNANSAIGEAIAEKFAQNNYPLILSGNQADALRALKERLETTYSAPMITLAFDIRNSQACSNALNSLEANWKNIDILVNYSGKSYNYASIHQGTVEQWEDMIDSNIKGLLFLSRLVSPTMVERQSGHIINIGEFNAGSVLNGGHSSDAIRISLDAITRSMALDLQKYQVKVSQVNPGIVEGANHDDTTTVIPSKDVAEVVYFIASTPSHLNIQDILLTGFQH